MTAPPPAAADRALLERLFAETGAAREAGAPGVTDYLRDAGARLGLMLRDLLAGVMGNLDAVQLRWLETAARALLALVLGLFLLAATRHLLRLLREKAPAAAGGAAGEPLAAPTAARDGAAWRAELEARLAAGDATAALEALWWWLARSLARGDADPAWTSGELLARGGRPDLAPHLGRLERLRYGARAPAAGEVRSLFARLEESLEAAP